MDKKNQHLVQLLQKNAREAISSLAKKLNLSRTAVHERLRKLELQGVIQGYTVRLNPELGLNQVRAHVMIEVAPQSNIQVAATLQKVPEILSLHTVSGSFDLLAMVRAENTSAIDDVLDQIGSVPGVSRTQSAIILSTKFER